MRPEPQRTRRDPAVSGAPSAERPPVPSLEVRSVTSHRGLLELETAWRELTARSELAHPFLTHEWIRTWWECFGRSDGLRILVLGDGSGSPVGLIPLRSDTTRVCGIGLARLGFPWNPHTPRLDVLVRGREEEAYEVLWRHLREEGGDWDLLQLCQLPEDSVASSRLAALASDEGFLVGRWRSSGSPYVSIRGGWERYLETLSSSFRRTLRNRMRRLEAFGEVELETVAADTLPASDLDRILDEGFDLEAAAWKGEAGTAIRSRPETRGFYRRLAYRMAARGWLRLHFLTVGGRRVAFSYGLAHGNRLYLLKGGYDPEYSRCSPGTVMYGEILRDAFARGFDELDLLGDAEPWKLRWTYETRVHHWLFVFRPTARAGLAHLMKFGLAPKIHSALPLAGAVLGENHVTA